MTKIVSFLLMGVLVFGSKANAEGFDNNISLLEQADDMADAIDFDTSDESDLDLRKCGKSERKDIRSLGRAFGFAIYPTRRLKHSFPSSEEVILKKLRVHSKKVSLSHGSLKIEKGVYRIAFGVSLKNTGSTGNITTWLTLRPSHVETGVIIPVSESSTSIPAPLDGIGFSVVQVSNNIFINVPETSLISLNYSTTGDVRLSQLSRFHPSCDGDSSFSRGHFDRTFNDPPNPFYLLAVKLANISI